MADEVKAKKDEAAAPAGAAGPRQMSVRLVPVENSDQPVVANYSSISMAPGMMFIDFGFIEPSMLAALPRVAGQGGKLPSTINGRLSVRVAMGYDGLANLHQQLGQLLTGLSAAVRERQAGAKKPQ